MTKDFLILQKELRELTSDKVDHLRTSFETWENDFRERNHNSFPEMEDLDDSITDVLRRIKIGEKLMHSWNDKSS